MSNISKIKINNQSYDLKDPNGLSVPGVKAATELNNMLTFDDSLSVTELTQEQFEAIISGDMSKVFPVGTVIILPSKEHTDTNGIGSGSITYTESAKNWIYAGNSGQYMIFFMYDTPYISEGYQDPNTGSPVYPANLATAHIAISNDPSSTIYSQYGYSTAAEYYKHLLAQMSAVIKDQFEEFFDMESHTGVSIRYLPVRTSIPKITAAQRMANRTNQGTATYRTNSTTPAFDYTQYNLGLMTSHQIFGCNIMNQQMLRVQKTYGSNISIVNSEIETYNFGGIDGIYKDQFPIFKYNDIRNTLDDLYIERCLSDRRVWFIPTSASAAQAEEFLIGLSGSGSKIIPNTQEELANWFFIPFVGIRIR